MRLKCAGLVAVALALSACGADVTQPSPSTPVSSLPHATPTSSLALSTIAPASPGQTLSPSPDELPGASASPIGTLQIPFANRAMTVAIVGQPGIVTAWRAATDRDLQAIAWDSTAEIALGRLSGRDVVLGWIGTVCDVMATLTVRPGRLVVSPVPRQGCDALAVGRGMVLTFAEPTDPTTITLALARTILLPEGG